VDLRFSPEQEAFRVEVRDFLETALQGEFASVRGIGGPGLEHQDFEGRLGWEQFLGREGWTCVGWPTEHGGRGLSIDEQVIWHEEYARAEGPGRVGIVGEGLLGPTLIAFGTDAQKARFLPGIVSGETLWCQGYSEPNAGSDLANVQTRAVLDGDEWILNGQKVWTSLAEWSQWTFVVARTDPTAPKHKGLSYLLVPMDQPGIERRPIVQATGTSEFNEVFFSDARTDADLIVGEQNQGWRVAMGTLEFERGVLTLGQQMSFTQEYEAILAAARRLGTIDEPKIRQRLTDAWIGLQLMRYTALRVLSGEPGPEMSINKLYWASYHRGLGELAMDVLGPYATVTDGFPYELTDLQSLFVFTRADTIYGGSNQIQRNVIGERVLGLPREPPAPTPSPTPAPSGATTGAPPPPPKPMPTNGRPVARWWSRPQPEPASASPRPSVVRKRGRGS
jgi:alkylation response protein AidB-like acyl-CoA dehydrogenase